MTSNIQAAPEDTLASELFDWNVSDKILVGLASGKEVTGFLVDVGADYIWLENSSLPRGSGWISLNAIEFVALAPSESES